MTPLELQQAASEAWVGLWHGCMAEAGGRSLLIYNEELVARALNGSGPEPKPRAQWATLLEGDERTSHLTLGDVLVGLEDYFRIFREIKKIDGAAYEYFSRVGAPLCFEQTRSDIAATIRHGLEPVVDAKDLPSYMGLFMTHSREYARAHLLEDAATFLDFQLYQKRRRNIAVAAPWKYTIYDHTEVSLDRDVLTKVERKRLPHAGTWGFHYYIGVAPDGRVRALPMNMRHDQPLRRGGVVHHNRFQVPPGLEDMKGKLPTVDHYAAMIFAVMRAYCAAALSGVQLSVRRGAEVARFGIPIGHVRRFFRDREREGMRRKPLMHLVGEYSYQRGNRQVTVGEHLRGVRHFTWRGYQIVISAPGIHHPAPEGFAAETLQDDDLLPLPKRTVPMDELASRMQRVIERHPRVPFRRGEPTVTYRTHSLK